MVKNQKPKKLLLKIPVYLSEMKEHDTGTLFDLKEQDIIDKLKRDINTYNEQNSNLCQFGKKGKSESVSVAEIQAEGIKFGEDHALLLRVSTERTNLCGGFLRHDNDKENPTHVDYADKLTISTNIVLLYPRIVFPKDGTTKGHWFLYVFIYEDPSKLNLDMSQLARNMLKTVFDAPIRNIKEDKFKEEIRTAQKLVRIEILLSNFEDGTDVTLPPKLASYAYSAKNRKETTISLENVASSDAEDLITDNSFDGYAQRIFRIFTTDKRKLTAKITERVKDAKVSLEQAFEDSFNFELEVEESDIVNHKLFETETIKANIECLLKDLFSN